MKPPPFAYFAPHTLDEALTLLAEHGARASVLAGGQSLVQRLNMRAVHPEALVDVNPLAELEYIRQGDGALAIGALARQQRLATSELARSACPLLAEAAGVTAFPAVRSRGTLGGSLANAEPGAQLPLALAVMDATVTVARRGGSRTIPIGELIVGDRATSLAPGELLTAVRVPATPPAAGIAMREYRRGYAGPPLLAVAAILDLDDAGAVRLARLGLGGADDIPLRLDAEVAPLVGAVPTAADFAAVAERAAGRVRHGDPVLADVPLRRRIVRALVAQTLEDARQRALARRGQAERGKEATR